MHTKIPPHEWPHAHLLGFPCLYCPVVVKLGERHAHNENAQYRVDEVLERAAVCGFCRRHIHHEAPPEEAGHIDRAALSPAGVPGFLHELCADAAATRVADGYRPGLFHLEGTPSVPGFTTGATWNGFACPLLPRESAIKLMQWAVAQSRTERGDEEAFLRIEPDGALVWNVPDWTEQDDEPGPETFRPNSDGLYDINTGSWTWSEVDSVFASNGRAGPFVFPDENAIDGAGRSMTVERIAGRWYFTVQSGNHKASTAVSEARARDIGKILQGTSQ